MRVVAVVPQAALEPASLQAPPLFLLHSALLI
jgi:hypothetical protein